jgi:hypothetical protein
MSSSLQRRGRLLAFAGNGASHLSSRREHEGASDRNGRANEKPWVGERFSAARESEPGLRLRKRSGRERASCSPRRASAFRAMS